MDAERRDAPLRVVFVTQTYHPVVGGAERQLQRLLPGLRARGIDPLVITRGLAGAARDDVVDGVPVRRRGSVRHGPLGSLGFFVATLWTLVREKPDVVHALSLMTPATIGAAYRAVGGAPLVVKALRGGLRGDLDRIRHKAFYGPRRALLSRSIDAAQVISGEIDAEFATVGVPAERRHRIPNGVDIEALSRGDGAALRASLGIAPAAPVFVYVGRLAPEKRLGLLVEAFGPIARSRPGARLLVVGDGPERDAIERASAATDGIVVCGPTDDVAAFLAAASVYVLPSSTEGMSNSMLEAMASGKAVVATDVGAARELLGDDERGWLVPPDDVTALREAMLDALREEEARCRGERARRHVLEHHGLDDTAARLARVYRSLARDGSPVAPGADTSPR